MLLVLLLKFNACRCEPAHAGEHVPTFNFSPWISSSVLVYPWVVLVNVTSWRSLHVTTGRPHFAP